MRAGGGREAGLGGSGRERRTVVRRIVALGLAAVLVHPGPARPQSVDAASAARSPTRLPPFAPTQTRTCLDLEGDADLAAACAAARAAIRTALADRGSQPPRERTARLSEALSTALTGAMTADYGDAAFEAALAEVLASASAEEAAALQAARPEVFPTVGATNGVPVDRPEDRPYQVEVALAEPYDAARTRPGSHTPVWTRSPPPPRPKSVLDDHRCGGVLVNYFWVLTAAHCVIYDAAPIRADALVVHLGSTRLAAPDGIHLDPRMRTLRVRRVIVDPDYRPSDVNAPPLNDAALLRLADPAPADRPRAIRPVDLVADEPDAGRRVQVAGWGYTAVQDAGDSRPEDQRVSSRLMRVDLTVLAPGACVRDLNAALTSAHEAPLAGGLAAGLFCAADPRPPDPRTTQATCFGDSGGPVTAEPGTLASPLAPALQALGEPGPGPQSWTYVETRILVGLDGWSFGCGKTAGVYTRVAHVLPWIRRVILGDPDRNEDAAR